jgi:hypothetical protein
MVYRLLVVGTVVPGLSVERDETHEAFPVRAEFDHVAMIDGDGALSRPTYGVLGTPDDAVPAQGVRGFERGTPAPTVVGLVSERVGDFDVDDHLSSSEMSMMSPSLLAT